MNRRKRASGYETQVREQAERYAATLRTGRSNDGGGGGMRCAYPPLYGAFSVKGFFGWRAPFPGCRTAGPAMLSVTGEAEAGSAGEQPAEE